MQKGFKLPQLGLYNFICSLEVAICCLGCIPIRWRARAKELHSRKLVLSNCSVPLGMRHACCQHATLFSVR